MPAMEQRGERRSPESQAARALVAAHHEAEIVRKKLERLEGMKVPAVVRRRRKAFAQQLAQAEEEERRQLQMLGGRPGALH